MYQARESLARLWRAGLLARWHHVLIIERMGIMATKGAFLLESLGFEWGLKGL